MAFSFASHVKTLPLEGTEAQVRWAKTIRQQKAEALQRLGTAGLGKALRPHIADEDLDRIGCTTIERAAAVVTGIAVHALMRKDAKWWIDNRNDAPEKWLELSARPVIDHYIANPPSWTDDQPPWDP